jgi:hypothetical protein
MCKPISLLSRDTANGVQVWYFDALARSGENPKDYTWDSHASIAAAFQQDEDRCTKWEFTAGELTQDREAGDKIASVEEKDKVQRIVDSWSKAKLGALLLAAVKQDGYVVQFLTEAQRTAAVCMATVKQDGYAVQFLTEAQRTAAVCMATVKRNGSAVRFLTEAQRKFISPC